MTTQPYAVIEVRPEWVVETEHLGSKPKFWYRRSDDEPEWLFKYPQENTGQHWAEKIAGEIAELLNIPHGRVELATFEDKQGSVTESFVQNGAELVHGNQLLLGKVLGYHLVQKFRNSDHTLPNIWQAIDSVFATAEKIESAKQRFAEYLIFDALIGNTDRHHENWGVLRERVENQWHDTLAPSFDHASSLGRELRDTGPKKSRQRLLEAGQVGEYVEKGRGGIYWSETDSTAPSPLELVRRGCETNFCHFGKSLNNLIVLDMFSVRAVVERVPNNWVSPLAREFALALISYTLEELRKLLR